MGGNWRELEGIGGGKWLLVLKVVPEGETGPLGPGMLVSRSLSSLLEPV